jgi:hypothetical protein
MKQYECDADMTEPEEWDSAAGAARFADLVAAFKELHRKYGSVAARHLEAAVAAVLLWSDGARVCEGRSVHALCMTLGNIGTDARTAPSAKVCCTGSDGGRHR